MPANVRSVECKDCGTPRPARPALGATVEPCDACGSTALLVKVEAHDTLTLRSSTTAKARTPGKRKPFIEIASGDSFTHSTGTWSKRLRVFDRRGDRYRERIEAEDGTVTRDVDVPLSEHRGHGSDRSQPKAHP